MSNGDVLLSPCTQYTCYYMYTVIVFPEQGAQSDMLEGLHGTGCKGSMGQVARAPRDI